MVLIVGLGNPGIEYAHTRHNVGFLWIEAARARFSASKPVVKTLFESSEAPIEARPCLFLKPLTFMNASGRALESFFKNTPLKPVLAVHDELELPLGAWKLQLGGGAKGHNGVRDLMRWKGGPEFWRLRIGIGRPEHEDVGAFVLGKFSVHERIDLENCFEKTWGPFEQWVATQG